MPRIGFATADAGTVAEALSGDGGGDGCTDSV